MARKTKSRRVLWEIMIELEEAGEEDICSLLNQVMGVQPYFGSGIDLAEYLDALTLLEARGDVQVRAYRIEGGRTIYGDVLVGGAAQPSGAFEFDSSEGIWRWKDSTRIMVELPDE